MANIEEFKRIELKIARVVEAIPHPNADKLLVLTIDTGSSTKQIVAGIARYYSPADLIQKQVVVVDNLDPAVIRGVTSNGMLLAASDGEHLSLIIPERPMTPGCTVR